MLNARNAQLKHDDAAAARAPSTAAAQGSSPKGQRKKQAAVRTRMKRIRITTRSMELPAQRGQKTTPGVYRMAHYEEQKEIPRPLAARLRDRVTNG